MSAIIKFQQVSKRYTTHTVLDQIDLDIYQGEFIGLVGVNGAGKTTLIKSLLDLCEIDTGKIDLFNVPHFNAAARTQLAFLPEQFTPPTYLTGKQFLHYMVKLYQQPYDLNKVECVCQAVDFPIAALSQSVRHYSKGMARKLGLISCFLSEKSLLILDEPMSGLDPKARAYLKHYLHTLKQAGITLFFSTHLLVDVETLCDRMAILHDGKLQFIGSPQACCAQFNTDNLEHAYLQCIGVEHEMYISALSGIQKA